MTEERSRYLLSLYLKQKANPEQQEELFEWINNQPDDGLIRGVLQQAWAGFDPADTMNAKRAEKILEQILEQKEKKVFWMRVLKWSAAAAILLAVSTIGYFYFTTKSSSDKPQMAAVEKTNTKPDAMPGSTSAKLTLGDGSTVLLDTLTGKTIASQGSIQIVKKNGQVVYENNFNGQTAEIFNTLTTDRGQQYPLTLSDGTKVFLNAASSIHFPVTFNGPERVVDITGEAYFEVAKNGKPFIVHASTAKVEVMGTHFDVNAYADESLLNTTLLEGSVKVSEGNAGLLLVPGQQAQIKKDGSIALNKNADTEAAVSWTQGYFHFSNASMETVLRQLSRWYKVDIVYEKHYPEETFGGDIQKSLTLSQVLKLLDKSQVKFRLQGKQLIVLK